MVVMVVMVMVMAMVVVTVMMMRRRRSSGRWCRRGCRYVGGKGTHSNGGEYNGNEHGQ